MKKNKKGVVVSLILAIVFIIVFGLVIIYLLKDMPTVTYVGKTQANILNAFEKNEQNFAYLDMATEIAAKLAKQNMMKNAGYLNSEKSEQTAYNCGKIIYPIINDGINVTKCEQNYTEQFMKQYKNDFEIFLEKYQTARLIIGDFIHKTDISKTGKIQITTGTKEYLSTPLYEDADSYYYEKIRIYNNMTTSEVAAASLEPQVKALLDTIAFAEGTSGGNGYRMMYTGKLFSDFSDHPRINNCGTFKNGKSVCSTAAGRYQFLASTWDSAAETLSLQDFSNKSQDLAAVYLIQKRGGLEPILKGQFEEAANAIRQEWASFPGAGYGQPEVELAKLKATYEERLAYYQNS